jgi:hypothetical protein
MGSSSYSDDAYSARASYHAKTGTDIFTHHADVTAGRTAAAVHDKLNPKKANAAGKRIRESFDSPEHPESQAIAVLFDVTGSMNTVPRLFLEKLPKLMALLVKKGYVAHPHILFGAMGDAYSDRVPIQIGQFEAGNEMDEALSLIFLEGNGGGQDMESYDLSMYYLARHTDMDCLKKRGKKGYLFILGDERLYPSVSKEHVEQHIGDTIEADIPVADLLTELREKFEVFWVMPGQTSHAHDDRVIQPMKKIFGERYLSLEEPGDVCELIASTIGLMEGYDLNGIKHDLKDVGADSGAVDRASSALVTFAGKAVTKAATSTAPLPVAAGDAVERL